MEASRILSVVPFVPVCTFTDQVDNRTFKPELFRVDSSCKFPILCAHFLFICFKYYILINRINCKISYFLINKELLF